MSVNERNVQRSSLWLQPLPRMVLICGLMTFGALFAQEPVQPSFEVASIHLVQPGAALPVDGPAPWSTFPNRRFFAHNLTLKLILGISYGIPQENIKGGPDWLDTQHYTIEAKVEGDKELTYDQMKPLINKLLDERFHLATHFERATSSGYALVVAKNGPKVPPATQGGKGYGQILSNGIQARRMTMSNFASLLSQPAGHPVVDKTGIDGLFDIKLDCSLANDPNSTLPSLFTALQEQLGLKLESLKLPIDILVIDHVDKVPTEN